MVKRWSECLREGKNADETAWADQGMRSKPAAEAPRSETTAQPGSAITVKIPDDLHTGTERRAFAGAFRRGLAGTHLAFVHLPLIGILARG